MLTLNVPSTDESAAQPAVDIRPKATAAWLARLPYASPVDVARQLGGALYALNRRPLDVEARYALLALYRPVVSNAAISLEALLAESGVPPSAQQGQIGTQLRDLLIEHSIGYKHILLAASRAAGHGIPPRRLAEVTARLLTSLRDIQIACYLTYSSPPAGLWLEMHQIYLLAQRIGLADKSVGEALPASLAYRQALLLALADPPHLSRAELVHTRQYLHQLGELAVLGPAKGNIARTGFPVATDSDHGPGQSGSQTEAGLWLDTDALCRHLHEIALRLRTGDSPRRIGLPHGMESELSLTLSQRLLKLWRTGAQRAFRRYPAQTGSVEAVAGIGTIHRLLDGGPHASDPRADSDDSLLIHDVHAQFAALPAVKPSRWTICNDSAVGLALRGAPDEPLNLKVGDALALRNGAAATWSLAVIRWIKMRDARQVELGVERLSPQMQPAWVLPLSGHRKATPEPALFVPGSPALQQPDRLMLSRHLYQPGMSADVWSPQLRATLAFGHRLAQTPGFDLIDFTLIANEPTDD